MIADRQDSPYSAAYWNYDLDAVPTDGNVVLLHVIGLGILEASYEEYEDQTADQDIWVCCGGRFHLAANGADLVEEGLEIDAWAWPAHVRPPEVKETGERETPEERLDRTMKSHGMIPLSRLLKGGSPLDAFKAHVGVRDLDTFRQWLEMKHEEYAILRARKELDPKDDMYQWVLAHHAVLDKVMANLRQAMSEEPGGK